MRFYLGAIAAALLALLLLVSNARAAELIMVRQAGCAWCLRWDREIGPAYPATEEGRFAPLRHVDIRDPLPVFVKTPVTVTPTFILIEGDREVGRLAGYPGADFFWEMLSEIFMRSSFGEKRP
jgi:thioredoxin-related protein